MSSWKHLFDSEWKQRDDIENLDERVRSMALARAATAKESRNSIEALERRVGELENDLGRTVLHLLATIRLLKETNSWDEKRFHQLLFDIDGQDGDYDGRAKFES